MTNIALLLRAHPEVAAGIERLVFMGGSAAAGNVTAVAEYNVFHDPEAAAITLAAARDLDIPVTMYGLDVFEQVLVDRADAGRLRGTAGPGLPTGRRADRARCDQLGVDAITIGDAGTVCAVADPDGLTTERLGVRVETGYGYTRGQTIVDRRESAADQMRLPGYFAATEVDVGRTRRRPRIRRTLAPHAARLTRSARPWVAPLSPGRRCPRSTATAGRR